MWRPRSRLRSLSLDLDLDLDWSLDLEWPLSRDREQSLGVMLSGSALWKNKGSVVSSDETLNVKD